MSAADLVPKVEPDALRVGLTWQWRREDLPDYPASTYTLTYRFRGASAGFTFNASADGTNHAVTVAAATTSGYTPGVYTGVGYVTTGSTVIEVWRGTLTVLPALSSGDGRTHVRIVLDAIEAVIEGRASHSDLEKEITTGAGTSRRLRHMPFADLLLLRETYKRYEAQEIAAEKITSGRPGGRKIVTRFVRPS